MQQRIFSKLSILAVLIISIMSLSFTAMVAPAQVSAASSKCISRQFNRTSRADICVNYIQRMLNITDGSALVIDGIYGTKTKAEVKVFQTAQGVTNNGIVGAATWTKLCAQQAKYKTIAVNAGCNSIGSNTPATAKKPPFKFSARAAQRDPHHGCDAFAYYQGVPTSECVKRIQRMFNTLGTQLDVDGIYGPRTIAVVKAWQAALQVKGDPAGTLADDTWDSICFWDGRVPTNGKQADYSVPTKTLAAWNAAAKRVNCTLSPRT